MSGWLMVGKVRHWRLRPVRHRLAYRIFSLLIDLDELAELDRQSILLSVNRANLYTFHERDHGDGRPYGLAEWVRQQLHAAGLPPAHRIQLLTMPTVLGFGFNPLSLYYCEGIDGTVAAVLYEVNNTFGERHCYLLEADTASHGASRLEQACGKRFHVSPFVGMDMDYRFRLHIPGDGDDRLSVRVAVDDHSGPLLVARYDARRRQLGSRQLLWLLLSHSLLPLKVLAGIHWEALHIWRKGVAIHRRPPPPPVPITIERTRS